MQEIESVVHDETNLNTTAKAVDLHKIGQAVLFVNARVDNLDERVTQLEKLLSMSSRENESLRRENRQLRDENRRLSTKEVEY